MNRRRGASPPLDLARLRMTAALYHARTIGQDLPGDATLGRVRTILFALEQALRVGGHRSLVKLHRAAVDALDVDGMLDPARVDLRDRPGGPFTTFADFERALLRDASAKVRDGVTLPEFASWAALAILAAPHKWPASDTWTGPFGEALAHVFDPGDIKAAIEGAMAGEKGWRDAKGQIVADARRLERMLVKAMRVMGIDARERSEPFADSKKARKRRGARKTSDNP